jgi:hypothetical protein
VGTRHHKLKAIRALVIIPECAERRSPQIRIHRPLFPGSRFVHSE